VSRQALIAVIDDDESFRPALVESLLSFGYNVKDFASAEEFMDCDQAVDYGCIVSDVHLTGMSGIDLKKLLASHGLAVPVILITARSDPGLEGRATASGAFCLLRKPFETAALMACLESALAAE